MSQNGFLCVRTVPENFEDFVKDWYADLKDAVPTWEELDKWGVHREDWNQDGTPNRPFLKKVTWRK